MLHTGARRLKRDAEQQKYSEIATLVSVTVGREQFRNAKPRFYTAWTLSGRRCCARLSGKRVLFGRYCPEGQLLAGRKSDPILWEKPSCQQLNEGENDALTPTHRARHYRLLRNHGCRDT